MAVSEQLRSHLRILVRALSLAVLVTSALMWLLLSEYAPRGAGAALPKGGDFVLQSAQGPLDSHSLRGQVVLLYFGYTFCPDVCPTSLTDMGKAIQSLGAAEQARVRGVFVSVDPARDTVQRLAEYAPYFHPRIVGVTGDEASLQALTSRYGASFRRVPNEAGEAYSVEHPSSVYVIAPNGELVERIAHGSPLEVWQHAIRDALAR
ncbi:MAG TPA: SCO family protein [Polyangiales bacterium]|nr:SCO family protein [Polyangiales bacterium]